MKRILLVAAAIACASLLGTNAQAGYVPLPTFLSDLLPPPTGQYTTSGGLTFSDFSYSTSGGPAANTVRVESFSAGNDVGLGFHMSFTAGPMASLDSSIDYTVTAAPGTLITDATSIGVGSSTGYWDVSEVIIDNDPHSPFFGKVIGYLEVGSPSSGAPYQDTINLAVGANSILVEKDIAVGNGSTLFPTTSASVSIVDQGFSVGGSVPEPASMALLGIGLTGLLAYRRRFKKASV